MVKVTIESQFSKTNHMNVLGQIRVHIHKNQTSNRWVHPLTSVMGCDMQVNSHMILLVGLIYEQHELAENY